VFCLRRQEHRVCASAYLLTAAMVRGFSLSKLVTMSLRSGRKMAGMETSRTDQRFTPVAAFSGSNE
jgi:hypothetical protein